MSTEKRSLFDSMTAMTRTISFNGAMVGHGGYSEVARQHIEQVKEQSKSQESDEYSPYNTVNS